MAWHRVGFGRLRGPTAGRSGAEIGAVRTIHPSVLGLAPSSIDRGAAVPRQSDHAVGYRDWRSRDARDAAVKALAPREPIELPAVARPATKGGVDWVLA
jgi:hypothetical protein